LKLDLQLRSKDLKQRKKQSERLSTNLTNDVQTWKDDIEQRELNLKQRRAKFEALKSERGDVQKKLGQMHNTLSVLSSRFERISTANSKKAGDYNVNMQTLRSASDKELNPRKDALQQSKAALHERKRVLRERKEGFQRGLKNKNWPELPSTSDLSEKLRLASENLNRAREGNKKVLESDEQRLSESLKKDEHDLLEKAWSKWIEQQPSLSPESKRYLTLEGRSLGMMKIKRNKSGLKEHDGALRRALTKAGINPEEFLAQYDVHCASEHLPTR
jgi:chromosome segregation ATPase